MALTKLKLNLSQINLYKCCAGSAKQISNLIEKQELTEAQEEGILAHDTVFSLSRGHEAPVLATEEMIRYATEYLTSLEPLLSDKGITKAFDEKVILYVQHDAVIEGVADFIAYDEKNSIVIVHEYKYGHVPVSIETDLQTVIYASAAYPFAKKAILSIEQPRSFGEKRSIKIYEDEEYRKIQIKARGVIFEASQENPLLTPGIHCINCPARIYCPALTKSSLNTASLLEDYEDLAFDKSIARRSRELSFLMQIKVLLDARVSALQDDFTHRIARGERVPGYSLKPVSSRLEWAIAIEDIRNLEKKYGISLLKNPEPITPLQAIKKGLPEQIVEEMAIRKTGALKLFEINREEIIKKIGENYE